MDRDLAGSSNEDNLTNNGSQSNEDILAESSSSTPSTTGTINADDDYARITEMARYLNTDVDVLIATTAVLYAHSMYGTDNANGDEESDHYTSTFSFDKMLPSEHSYLGDDMEERRGRTIWEDNSYQTVHLLPPPAIVLVPGQILPLTVADYYTIRMLEHCIAERDGMFGVMVKWPVSSGQLKDPDYVGTTAEIYEFHRQTDETGQTRQLTIKAKARQRFKAVQLDRDSDGHLYLAKVRILPEVVLLDAFHHINPHINRCRSSNSVSFRKRGAVMTRWPLWVYDQYHPPKLVARVENELEYLKRGRDFELPKNPTQLSFWVAQNLPPKQRLVTLKLNSPIQRLRWELSVLEKCQMFLCSHCQNRVGHQCDIIAMSVDGPQGTYVNPEGYLHETITLSRAMSLTATGSPSTEYSWFPGYAWIPAYCFCRSHIGWKFVATRDDLQPQIFWGLSRRSLKIKIDLPESIEEGVHVM